MTGYDFKMNINFTAGACCNYSKYLLTVSKVEIGYRMSEVEIGCMVTEVEIGYTVSEVELGYMVSEVGTQCQKWS